MSPPTSTKFWKNADEHNSFVKCRGALVSHLRLNPPSTFPRFQDPNLRKGTVSYSHAVRSGFEHAGDTYLYMLVDCAMDQFCPAQFSVSQRKITRAAVTCNQVLGEFMAALKMIKATVNKTGGDAWETVWGALVDDLGFFWALEWILERFQSLILVCVDTLSPTLKRKHAPEDDALQAPTRAAKRLRTDPPVDDTSLRTITPSEPACEHSASPKVSLVPSTSPKVSLLDFLANVRRAANLAPSPFPDPAPSALSSNRPASTGKTTPTAPAAANAQTSYSAADKPRAPLSLLTNAPAPAKSQSRSVAAPAPAKVESARPIKGKETETENARAKVEPARHAKGKENDHAANGSRDLARARNVGSGRLLDRLAPRPPSPHHDSYRAMGRADYTQDGRRSESYEDRHWQADRRRADGYYGGQDWHRRSSGRYDDEDDNGDRRYERQDSRREQEREDERRARYADDRYYRYEDEEDRRRRRRL
ncbi:hypothetical protein DFH06DRAFT_323518 [Mycena polygramma]|nr:hypothetical protein DFH06DRAFT_323518 [Mycena polygramma]